MFRTLRDAAGTVLWLGLTISAISSSPAVFGQVPADNTKVNKRDRSAVEPTADKQSNNRSDLAITRDIRRALMNDKHLSTYAHNVKVITQNGLVTLKGPVRTEEEKTVVESKAGDIAGSGHVTSEISIAPAKPAKAKP